MGIHTETMPSKKKEEVSRLGGITDEWFLNLVVNPLIPYVPEWVHPNQITACSLLCGILGPVSAVVKYNSSGHFYIGLCYIWASLIAFGCYTMDCLDGQIARKRNKCSAFGGFLDHWCDSCSIPNLFYACHQFLVPNCSGLVKYGVATLGSFIFNIQLLHAHFVHKAESADETKMFMAIIAVLQTLGWCYVIDDPTLMEYVYYFIDNVTYLLLFPCASVIIFQFLPSTTNQVRLCYLFNVGVFAIHFSWSYFGVLGIQETLRTGVFLQWYMNSNTVKIYEFRRKYDHPWRLLVWVLSLPLLKYIHPNLLALVPIHILYIEMSDLYKIKKEEF